MCQLYSWIEKDDKVVFLTADDVFKSKRGRELQKYNPCREDWHGHGAIRWYYNFEGGKDCECTDFSEPSNFPPELQQAIITGKMWGFNITGYMQTMVEQPALAEYRKVEQLAWAEYEKVKQATWAEYKKVEQSAWAEYEKVKQAAWAKIYSDPQNRIPAWRISLKE